MPKKKCNATRANGCYSLFLYFLGNILVIAILLFTRESAVVEDDSGAVYEPVAVEQLSEQLVTLNDMYLAVDSYLEGGQARENVEEMYGKIEEWDTSRVTSFYNLFANNRNPAAAYFTADLSQWDVSNVTNMRWAFRGAASFNSDISQWDVRRVENFYRMFWGASSLNVNLCSWGPKLLPTATTFEMFLGTDSCPVQSKDFSRVDLDNLQDSTFCFSCQLEVDDEQVLQPFSP